MSKNTTATPTSEIVPEPAQNAVLVSTGGAARQNTLRNVGLIIGREYKHRTAQRSFVISTIVILILIAITACVPTIVAYLSSRTTSPTKMSVVNAAGTIASFPNDATLTQYMNSSLNGNTAQSAGGSGTGTGQGSASNSNVHFTINTATEQDVRSLQQKVRNGGLDLLLLIERGSDNSLHFTYYTNHNVTSDPNQSQVQALAGQLNVLDRAARLHLTPAQTSSLFTAPAFNIKDMQQSQDSRSVADQVTGYFIAYAGVILIFMSVFLYGVGVAQGVAEEKGSRIMEILINAATPFQLMAGKILGLGLAGLTQMVCVVAVGISALLLQTPLQHALLGTATTSGLSINITSVSITILLLVLLYFILGFLLYATLFAAAGALVKRQDEVQNASQPISFLFMIGYLVSLAGGATSANTTWMKVLSYVPFWTPTIMLTRIGAGSVSWWEIALSVLIMIVAIAVCTLISARIYRYGVLMYGQKPKLGQLFKLARSR